MELKMYRLKSSSFSKKDSSYKSQFCTNVCANLILVTLVLDMPRWKIKVKNLMCQISVEILEYGVIPNSSYQNLKIFLSKLQKKYSKMNECIRMNAIAKLWNFSRRFKLNYEILLPVLNTFAGDTEEYSLKSIP